jgi:hypothetical protein
MSLARRLPRSLLLLALVAMAVVVATFWLLAARHGHPEAMHYFGRVLADPLMHYHG